MYAGRTNEDLYGVLPMVGNQITACQMQLTGHLTGSLNIWRHTSRFVKNARDLPPAGVYIHLWPTFIPHREICSQILLRMWYECSVWASMENSCHRTFFQWKHCIQWNHWIFVDGTWAQFTLRHLELVNHQVNLWKPFHGHRRRGCCKRTLV